MELSILNGSYTATSSPKAAEDDELSEALEKYATNKKDEKLLTKEKATEAALELMEQRKKCDTMDDMEHVKGIFG